MPASVVCRSTRLLLSNSFLLVLVRCVRMRKVYFTIFFLVFALTIYGSGIAEKDAVTPHIAARFKRTEAPAFLLSSATELPSVEIVKLAESGVVANRNVTTKSRIKSLKNKIPFRKSSDGLEKRKPFLKRVKGLKRKIPFRKKTEIDKKLDLLPDLEFQADSGIVTNDRIGEVNYPREPISTRIRNLGSKLTLRRRAGSKSDVKDFLLPGETGIVPDLASVISGISSETLANPPSSEEFLNAFAALSGESETSPELPVISSESALLLNNTPPTAFENGPVYSSTEVTTSSTSVKTSTPIPQSVLSEFAALLSELADRGPVEPPNASAEISHAPITSPPSKTTVDNGTKRPLLSRVKNLSKKIPLRRKTPSIQSKSDSIEVDVESRGADEYRLARLNVWWVQNYVTTENSKPTAYYDEETIAVVGFDGTLNATTCRLLEPVLKEEKDRALEDLSSAGVDLKPVTLDVMMEMISGCKEDGVPDDKWTAWTLLNGILPGTKWCGRGDVARSYEELGPEADIDRCCRAHDHCPVKIKPFKRKFGLTNISLYTKSHCECDDEFDMCLRATKNPLADILGNFYFNVLKVQCMEEAKYAILERCLGNDCDNPKYGKMRFRDPRRFVRKLPV